MPRLRSPSRIEPLNFPVFGLAWYADVACGHQWVAYCGGGGSAKTGVKNQIVVLYDGGEEVKHIIDTGDDVALTVELYPRDRHSLLLLASLGRTVVQYLVEGQNAPQLRGSVKLEKEGDLVNTLSLNSTLTRAALGCESSDVIVYEFNAQAPDPFGRPLFTLQGHTKAVCQVKFSHNCSRLVSSSKDGSARVWNATSGECIQTLTCQVRKLGTPPPPGRPKQIIVRGCAFCDMDGTSILTVASGRRDDAYLTLWLAETNQTDGPYRIAEHTYCSKKPVTSMAVSIDDKLLTYAAVDGAVTLFDLPNWKVLRTFPEVHDLPVTCVAARPFYPSQPFRGELGTGVTVHAMSASADSKMSMLTLMKRAPTNKSSGGGPLGFLGSLLFRHWFLVLLFAVGLSLTGRDSWEKCIEPIMISERRPFPASPWWEVRVGQAVQNCIVSEILWAPPEQLPPR